MWVSGATLAHCTQRVAHSKSIDIIRTRFGCVRRVDEAEVRCEPAALLDSMCPAIRCIRSATCARARRQASDREALFRVPVVDNVREQMDIPPVDWTRTRSRVLVIIVFRHARTDSSARSGLTTSLPRPEIKTRRNRSSANDVRNSSFTRRRENDESRIGRSRRRIIHPPTGWSTSRPQRSAVPRIDCRCRPRVEGRY